MEKEKLIGILIEALRKAHGARSIADMETVHDLIGQARTETVAIKVKARKAGLK